MRALRRLGRAVSGIVGAACLLIAWRYLSIPQSGVIDMTWPWLFAAAGVLSLLWAIMPANRALWIITGGATFTAFTARSVAILVGWAHGTSGLSTAQVHIAAIVWALTSVLYAYAWRGFAPIRASRRTLRTVSHGENVTPHFSKPRGA